MFKTKLLEIKQELEKHDRDKNSLLQYYINNRLSQSLRSYYKELNDSYNYLDRKDSLKTLKQLNKDSYD